MSPEGAAYGIEGYTKALQKQADVAEAFFYGRMGEGIEGLLELPQDIRSRIDQILWDASGGEPIDPTDPAVGNLISESILFSLEERMGLHA